MILETALICMAANIYHEAKNQPRVGQIAVAQVVMNRVKDSRYPNTICDVVKQGLTYKNGKVVLGKCQFSWYCDRVSDWPSDEKLYKRSKMLADVILNSSYKPVDIGNATLYHACSGTNAVTPGWDWTKVVFVAKIGDHCFYTEE